MCTAGQQRRGTGGVTNAWKGQSRRDCGSRSGRSNGIVPGHPRRARDSAAGAAGLGLALAGCASAVVVESDFPTPLVETLPLAVGLYYEPELKDFIHAEALPRSSTWTIDLGDANVAMLQPVYDAMFASTREIEPTRSFRANSRADRLTATGTG